MNIEQVRLKESNWKKWGPYLTDRQWGTVREDYSENGSAWDYITHDMARSKAYRWGEEGIGGISDDQQLLCFALAFWNKKDPILKERFFGITGSEGNHGEDVKEYYYYLDSTPTHSYMKMLYKYPQLEFPYSLLVEESKRRSRTDPEFELIETGIFNEDKYFDIFIEFAKAETEDILIKITIHNRGTEIGFLNVLPTVWFRNTWSWGNNEYKPGMTGSSGNQISIDHSNLGNYRLFCEGAKEILFTDNETNKARLYQYENGEKYCKDGINDYLVNGKLDAINPEKKGTKAAANFDLAIDGGGSQTIRLRLVKGDSKKPFQDFDAILQSRLNEANEFYKGVQSDTGSPDSCLVQRQALAGMMWSKQFFYFNVKEWLKGDPSQPEPPAKRKLGRNSFWKHLSCSDIISMPDKWEYPWFAGWDLAFHCLPISLIDRDFAKEQLLLLTKERYMHPNGQLPAYEWAFGDVNPPVLPWAAYFVYIYEKEIKGTPDLTFLKTIFHKLLLNFTWWVNRKDPDGKNVFEGGFLGLDNISVFDRSAPLPGGGSMEQADGTAWMAFFCQNMLMISLELADNDPVYEEMAMKFLEHFYNIASAISGNEVAGYRMWDNDDHFFYDLLCLPNGDSMLLKIRSMVGLLPLCAATVFPPSIADKYPGIVKHVRSFLAEHPELEINMTPRNAQGAALLSIVNETKLRFILEKMLDENEFFGKHGLRSVSQFHRENPYIIYVDGQEFRVDYWPAESQSGLFGGNSNWRGPVWFPINALIIRALHHLYLFYGDDFKIECPTGSGNLMNLSEVNHELAHRLISIFQRDENGDRPLNGKVEKFQKDPNWRDYLMFHEYFHGDTGAGLGANHQTGWSGFVALLIQLFESKRGESFLKMREEAMRTNSHKEEKPAVSA